MSNITFSSCIYFSSLCSLKINTKYFINSKAMQEVSPTGTETYAVYGKPVAAVARVAGCRKAAAAAAAV